GSSLFQELCQIRSKVERGLVCSHTPQIFERPDDASRAHIDAAVAVLYVVIHRMRRPEPLATEMRERVCDDLVNGLSSGSGVPGQRPQLNVPRLFVHEVL